MPTPDQKQSADCPYRPVCSPCRTTARPTLKDNPKALDEVDPVEPTKSSTCRCTSARLAGVAVDAVFDSVSVGTTFREQLAEGRDLPFSRTPGSTVSELLIEKLARWCRKATTITPFHPPCFSDGSFAYIPKGVKCPMELFVFASMPKARASLNARSSLPKKAAR